MEVRGDFPFKGTSPQPSAVDLKYRRQWREVVSHPIFVELGDHPQDCDPDDFILLVVRDGFENLWCETNSVLRTPHACGTKFQSARVLGLVIVQPGIPVRDQGRSGHCSLAAMWSKDSGQARSGRRFKIDA